MNIEQIFNYLPHRYPFLLIDKVTHFVPYQSITAIKNVTINEPFFQGHFPGKPVMPGVLILEAMAQAGGVLAYRSTALAPGSEGILPYLAGIEKVRFRRVVEPGDQLRLEVKVLRAKQVFWKLETAAYVGDELACSAEILSALKNNTEETGAHS